MEISTSPKIFQERLENQSPRECTLVGFDSNARALGFASIKRYTDRIGYRVACETSIYLDRSVTGGGLGTALMTELLERCRTFEYHHIVAKIWTTNTGSLRFHERFGFTLVGIQKEIGYLNSTWQDIAILQRVLDDVPAFQPHIH